ncbi:MAG TPA: phosphate/phosphite/phosphonate ABC transporter substrate-binding protein [Caulobacteraceae bacterium]|jgi:phosphonate transport system substrate-binding protein|nr:phosphate/phosphite/phosphonate ABC transporter substrate-binding protein [Caulobacteraceae bacterium]
MMTRRHFAALGAGGLALAACKPAGNGSAGIPGELRFSILSVETAQNLQQHWGPVLADMATATGLKITPFFSTNYTALVEAMRFKQTDVGWFSNESGLEAVRRADGEVFARTTDADGADGYHSVLLVNAKSDITLERVLKCDKTLTFGMGDAQSTSGTLAPLTYLFAPKGIRPETCFKTVRSGATHQANLFSVAHGQLDVATNNDRGMMLATQRGVPEVGEVKVIWTSPLLPEDPIIWRKDLDPAVKEKVRQFFLTYGQGDTPAAQAQHANLVKLSIGGFLPADNNHLLPVREIEATRDWLQAKETGDPAKIAATRKTLDAIQAQRQALEGRTAMPAGAQ